MAKLQAGSYRELLRNRSFLAFCSGFTLSAIGDSLTRVALTWLVSSQSPGAVHVKGRLEIKIGRLGSSFQQDLQRVIARHMAVLLNVLLCRAVAM